MRYFIYLTPEGTTRTPQNIDIENLQVLGIASGESEQEAFENLIKENEHVENSGYNDIFAMELINDNQITLPLIKK